MLYCKHCNKFYFRYRVEKNIVGKISLIRTEYDDEDVIDEKPELLEYCANPDYYDYDDGTQYFCAVCDASNVTKYKAKYSDVYDTSDMLRDVRDEFVLNIIPYIESLRKDDCIDLSNLSVEDGFRLKQIIDTYYE